MLCKPSDLNSTTRSQIKGEICLSTDRHVCSGMHSYPHTQNLQPTFIVRYLSFRGLFKTCCQSWWRRGVVWCKYTQIKHIYIKFKNLQYSVVTSCRGLWKAMASTSLHRPQVTVWGQRAYTANTCCSSELFYFSHLVKMFRFSFVSIFDKATQSQV